MFRSSFAHLKLLFFLFDIPIRQNMLLINLSLMDNSNLAFSRKNVTNLVFARLATYRSSVIVFNRIS